MNLRILALDFDGTIATEGVLDRDAAEAIDEARAAGARVLLVTARMLSDLDALALEASRAGEAIAGAIAERYGETNA